MPARHKPHRNRNASMGVSEPAASMPRLNKPPAKAHAKNINRGENRSGSASHANNKVPVMNPSCIDEVIQPSPSGPMCMVSCKPGNTALPANHKLVPANCDTTMTGRILFGRIPDSEQDMESVFISLWRVIPDGANQLIA